jgi:hypothetical protein
VGISTLVSVFHFVAHCLRRLVSKARECLPLCPFYQHPAPLLLHISRHHLCAVARGLRRFMRFWRRAAFSPSNLIRPRSRLSTRHGVCCVSGVWPWVPVAERVAAVTWPFVHGTAGIAAPRDSLSASLHPRSLGILSLFIACLSRRRRHCRLRTSAHFCRCRSRARL